MADAHGFRMAGLGMMMMLRWLGCWLGWVSLLVTIPPFWAAYDSAFGISRNLFYGCNIFTGSGRCNSFLDFA